MIRLTRQTDYGIVLLSRFAAAPQAVVHNAREVAAEAHLPLPMVSKILKKLAREGLLVSLRGVKGGYSLARPAASITVAEAIDALEGPIAMTACTGSRSCRHEEHCGVRGNWQKINQALREALESLTLLDMSGTLDEKGLVSLTRRPAAVAAIETATLEIR